MSHKWNKRKIKGIGLLKQAYSYVTLKYTPWQRARLQKQIEAERINRIHAGCGEVSVPGWLNIEFEPRKIYGCLKKSGAQQAAGPLTWHLNYNLLKEWPVKAGVLSHIAAAHLVEHFDLNGGIAFVRSAYRALRTGGTLRLSCPDLRIYAENYVKGNQAFFDHPKVREWCTYQAAATHGEIFAAKAYDSGGSHKWFYDALSLVHICQQAGFHKVRPCRRLEGQTPDLDKIELADREIESVYVEAVK